MGQAHRLTAHRAIARGLPPQMPADQIERLPFFGRTWYVHGVGYWFRRVVTVLMTLLLLAFACRVEVALFDLTGTIGSETGRWIGRIIWAGLLIASFIAPARALNTAIHRYRNHKILRPEWIPGTRTSTGGGPALAAATRAGSTLAGAVLFIGFIAFFGWFLAFVLFALLPEVGLEHDARLRLQRRKTQPDQL